MITNPAPVVRCLIAIVAAFCCLAGVLTVLSAAPVVGRPGAIMCPLSTRTTSSLVLKPIAPRPVCGPVLR